DFQLNACEAPRLSCPSMTASLLPCKVIRIEEPNGWTQPNIINVGEFRIALIVVVRRVGDHCIKEAVIEGQLSRGASQALSWKSVRSLAADNRGDVIKICSSI